MPRIATPALGLVALSLALAACGSPEPPEAADPVVAPVTSAATPAETPSGDITAASAVATEGQIYDCGGRPLTFRFDAAAGGATVMFDGVDFDMRQAEAASGAKYADEQGNTFWTRGGQEATLTLAGAPDIACASPAAGG